ncbi:MAG TPA: glycosyltransferase [Mycobacteriales bacterium]|nr:glycosyltransferase [Mycobacteriales bacterium]
MNVLVVLAEPPLAEGGAAGRCGRALIQGLVAHGLAVRAVAAGTETVEVAGVTVEAVRTAPERPGWAGRAQRLRRPRGELARGGLGDRVRELARDADVVHLEEVDTAWCSAGLAMPSIVHLHYRVRLDPRGPLRPFVEYDLAERAAIRRHRWLAASSPVVAATLRRPGKEVVEHRLALDPAAYAPATLAEPVAGLIGTLDWPPTRAALDRLRTVWPVVRRAVPDATLRIAGRGVAEPVPGAEHLGAVASAAAFVAGLGVLLYPVPRGSGAKVKVLEAMATGVPVVTTVCGAEGVPPNDGVLVCHDDAALAHAATELLRDPAARRERGAAARAAFLAHHAPEPATAPLAEAYRRMA